MNKKLLLNIKITGRLYVFFCETLVQIISKKRFKPQRRRRKRREKEKRKRRRRRREGERRERERREKEREREGRGELGGGWRSWFCETNFVNGKWNISKNSTKRVFGLGEKDKEFHAPNIWFFVFLFFSFLFLFLFLFLFFFLTVILKFIIYY